ncbi:MAG: hypothetical protein RJS97_08640 [Parvibaculaceae bacterium]
MGLTLKDANLHVSSEVVVAYFPDCENVGFLLDDGTLWAYPLARGSAGGSLLKRKNLHGDRVVLIADVVRAGDVVDGELEYAWDETRCALGIVLNVPAGEDSQDE